MDRARPEGEQVIAATYKVLGADGPPAREVVATVSTQLARVLGVI
jgi:hypothetical protein